MTMMSGTHGVSLTLKTGANLTGWTLAQVVIVSPSGVRTVATATVSDVTNGWVLYETEQNVFALDGVYKVQAVVTISGGAKLWKSEVVEIDTEESL